MGPILLLIGIVRMRSLVNRDIGDEDQRGVGTRCKEPAMSQWSDAKSIFISYGGYTKKFHFSL